MTGNDKVEMLAERLRAANIMGRSEALKKLFDFLVERSGDATAPKEIEVAGAIFGAPANFDVAQDASVRVYIHRLRNKLDEYYEGPGRNEIDRLSIPKGVGYRIIAEPLLAQPVSQLSRDIISGGNTAFRIGRGTIAAVIALFVAANVIGWVLLWPQQNQEEFATVRGQSPWNELLQDSRPITLVIGDYYIFGELGRNGSTDRLVREYGINSPSDLDNYLMQHPELSDQFMDLDLYYLPVSTAFALRSIMPILAPTAKDRERIHIVQSSGLTPDMIKRTNIVYVGFLSGLGLLREPVFAGSRFSVGETYDELIDNVGKRRYLSQEIGPYQADRKLRDIGYFSTFAGPNGNRIIVVAGTRDIAVMETAEAVSDLATLDVMIRKTENTKSFEALYEAEGIRRLNLGGRLMLVSPLKADKIWNAQPDSLRFPNG